MKQSFDAYKKKQLEHWNRDASWGKSACSIGALTNRNTFEGALIREGDAYQNEGSKSITYDIPLTERIL